MLKKDSLISVFMGGPGSEREVSLASGNAVLNALKKEGYTAVAVDVKDTTPDVPEGTELVFNVIHGTYGEDGELQRYLRDENLPYTGAGELASEFAFDKNATKKVFLEKGVPTPTSEIIYCTEGLVMPKMDLPYVVKPPREGSSVGVSIVNTEEEARQAIEEAMKFSDDILIEEFVEGKELTVGILDGEVLPVVHIAPRSGFYDIKNKYPWMAEQAGEEIDEDTGSDYYCPADLDEETTNAVQSAALAAYKSLEIEVYSRVDVLLNSLGKPYVLEINTIPGMTETSLLPKAAQAAGIEFGPLCVRIAEISLQQKR